MPGLKDLVESHVVNILANPIIKLTEDAVNIKNNKKSIRSAIHFIITFTAFISGIIISTILFPEFGKWLYKITSSVLGDSSPTMLNFTSGYFAACLISYPVSEITTFTIRKYCKITYGDEEYILTPTESHRLADLYGSQLAELYDDPDMTVGVAEEKIRDMWRFCIQKIRSKDSSLGSRDADFLEIMEDIKNGDFETFFDLQELIIARNQKLKDRELEISAQRSAVIAARKKKISPKKFGRSTEDSNHLIMQTISRASSESASAPTSKNRLSEEEKKHAENFLNAFKKHKTKMLITADSPDRLTSKDLDSLSKKLEQDISRCQRKMTDLPQSIRGGRPSGLRFAAQRSDG